VIAAVVFDMDGVTPDVMWQAQSPGAYDESLDRQLAAVQRETYSSDSLCKPV
jgi:beta-phosphoglucomutase-like phosphatase (HAD superfamily)